MQALYDGRRAALENIVADMLLAEEAKKKGMSPDAYVESEVAKRVKPVSDAEVVTFYQSNINQMQGRSLEQMSPAINRYLSDQQRETARGALIAELKKAGPAIRVSLDPPRQSVDAGVHRSRGRSRRRRRSRWWSSPTSSARSASASSPRSSSCARSTATSCGSCGRTFR